MNSKMFDKHVCKRNIIEEIRLSPAVDIQTTWQSVRMAIFGHAIDKRRKINVCI